MDAPVEVQRPARTAAAPIVVAFCERRGYMTRNTKSKNEAIKPDQQDFEAVEKEYGPLRPNASKAALAERYRLAQVAKVIRQLEQVAFSRKRKISKV
jgi:hypothetical protein